MITIIHIPIVVLTIVLLVGLWLTRHIWTDKKHWWTYAVVGGIGLGGAVIVFHAVDRHHERKKIVELQNKIEDATRRLDRIIEKLQERALEEAQREIEGIENVNNPHTSPLPVGEGTAE